MHSIDIGVSRDENWTVLSAVGSIDMASVADLHAAIDGQASDRVALDLSKVDFIDSTGLRALLIAVRDRPGLVLLRPSEPVTDLLTITALTDRFSVIESLAELNRDG